MKNLDSFYTAFSNEFWHYTESVIDVLRKKNKEYDKKRNLIENKLDLYSNFRTVIDDLETVALNINVVKLYLICLC